MGYIYLIENTLNQKKYVGQTKQRLSQRVYQHFQQAKKGVETPLYHALRKYSRDTFKIVTLEETDLLDEREQHYIELYNTYKEGYNCDKGGQGITGFSHTEETKRKMSAAKKGKPSHRKGKTNIHSAESNRKRSESLKRAYAEGKRKGQDYSWMKGDMGPNSKARRALRGA
jgi:group I intron endonuclease